MTDLAKTVLPDTKALLLERQGAVLTIWLNRPEAKNALSAEMSDELSAVLDAVHNDRSLRAIVLRGKGGVFCAGGDIKGFKSGMQVISAEEVAQSNRSFGDLLIKLNEQPQVVIILVEGAAIGGSLGLACVADIVAIVIAVVAGIIVRVTNVIVMVVVAVVIVVDVDTICDDIVNDVGIVVCAPDVIVDDVNFVLIIIDICNIRCQLRVMER